jgi:hypothetical protein
MGRIGHIDEWHVIRCSQVIWHFHIHSAAYAAYAQGKLGSDAGFFLAVGVGVFILTP